MAAKCIRHHSSRSSFILYFSARSTKGDRFAGIHHTSHENNSCRLSLHMDSTFRIYNTKTNPVGVSKLTDRVLNEPFNVLGLFNVCR